MLKPVKIIKQEAVGNIENSLYESMINNGLNEELTYLLSDIYAWTIDFFRLQKGDSFKIIYTSSSTVYGVPKKFPLKETQKKILL